MTKPAAATLYESDYYTWALTQAQALRQGLFKDLDLPNLIEEVEDMARSEARELESRLVVLLAHLLKWAYQAEARSKSWRLTIKEQRLQVRKSMRDNPGLKSRIPEIFNDAYESARLQAAKETPFEEDDFPADCPWTFEQAVDDGFYPDAPASAGNGGRKAPRQGHGRKRP